MNRLFHLFRALLIYAVSAFVQDSSPANYPLKGGVYNATLFGRALMPAV